ncbi:MAG: nucleotidyltransferase family protein [Deltaproteobacteria bacterium]|nr:nucleotidyltransferase family protein [Deltaproteobacteria bacterium]
MKAFLLAAGRGTRLRPYTDTIPKCLIPIQGKPLLGIWLDHLRLQGVREVLINTHHHAHQVEAFVRGYSHCREIRIVLSNEPELLGSAGTIRHCRDFVDNEDDFMIFYADNLTNVNLKRFAKFHHNCRRKNGILTMGLFHAPNPSACGIAELDADQKILAFTEKPENPKSDLANAGIYMASREIFECFPEAPPKPGSVLDFGLHVLPLLAGRMYGYPIAEYLRDVGTIESYQQALTEWPVYTDSQQAGI